MEVWTRPENGQKSRYLLSYYIKAHHAPEAEKRVTDRYIPEHKHAHVWFKTSVQEANVT